MSPQNPSEEEVYEPVMTTDIDMEEFFLTKNSKLFSQVSTNTLQTLETPAEPNDCKVVEVKALEIVKSVAATSNNNRVVLPKANFGVQQVPQVGWGLL